MRSSRFSVRSGFACDAFKARSAPKSTRLSTRQSFFLNALAARIRENFLACSSWAPVAAKRARPPAVISICQKQIAYIRIFRNRLRGRQAGLRIFPKTVVAVGS
jgi:hypothetical protein